MNRECPVTTMLCSIAGWICMGMLFFVHGSLAAWIATLGAIGFWVVGGNFISREKTR